MNDGNLNDIDGGLVSLFEQDWLKGEPNNLTAYLPPPSDPRFLGTLEELVHIDLEFRWKNYRIHPSPVNAPLAVETYWEKFPQLEEVKLGLIQSEFELANQFGDKPSVQVYVDRFGESVGATPLRPILQNLLADLRQSQVVRPGTTIGRYEITQEHGRGGFGAVWRATDTKLGRRIAVKQLGHRLATDAESRRRFMSEARVTAKLEHPGIVPVYDISSQGDDFAYYTMRLIQGRTLAEAIDVLHSLDPLSSAFELMRQKLLQSFVDVCQAIQYAHSQGVIHRDLKPQNMIVGDYGETIVLDWGLASVIDAPYKPTESILLQDDPEVLTAAESLKTLSGAIMGTPAYMPPEQARGELAAITRRSDVYSLGATLYHLITGKVPFTDGPLDELIERVKLGQIPRASTINARVEKSLSAIAAQAMQVEPRDRYGDCGELLEDVQKFLADQPISAYRDSLPARASRWIRRNPTTAATVAMTLFFVSIALIASLMVHNAWRLREDKRVTDIQIAVERADATAISQIQSGRFESAAQTLRQAIELMEGEPRLTTFSETLAARRERTQKIVDFYNFSMQAQEETFFDRLSRSATYCQSAVDRLGVLDHSDWWSHLPDQDLTALQVDQLQTEVYRILGLLSSMRLAQTAEAAFSFDLLTDPQKVESENPRTQLIRAAGFAASQGNRFRRARGLRLIEEVAQANRGERIGVDLTNLKPLNSIDSAMMGSILDNNVPREGITRQAISALLGFRDPNEVARQWLDDGLKYNPDWYWLPVFRGVNQLKTGDAEESIKLLSHAIGIRPDYWVGYQYRAWASVTIANGQDVTAEQRATLLNSASHDVERALDLEKNKPQPYWIQAIVLSSTGAPESQVNQAFLRAIALSPKLHEIRDGHFSAVSGLFHQAAKKLSQRQAAAGRKSSDLFELQAVMLLWQGQHEEAMEVCQQGMQVHAENPDLQRLQRLIQLDQQPGSAELQPIEVNEQERFAWQVSMANAQYFFARNDSVQEAQQLTAAIQFAPSDWQRSIAQIELARNLVQNGQTSRAVALVHEATASDRAVDISRLLTVARNSGANELESLCQKLRSELEPKTQFSQPESDSIHPPLLNRGFELGLSYHWNPNDKRGYSTTWKNMGLSKTVAESSSISPRSGQRCLAIALDSPIAADSFGSMTQTVPVTQGANYTLSFWARAENLSAGSVQVGVIDAGDPPTKGASESTDWLVLDGNSFEWKKHELLITAQQATLPISIVGQGSGHVWFDDFEISLSEAR
ncbi:MAG: protein kinase [Pirellulaceae bacterium]|nr:protein kinase [Pirellulaceae bacterium]